MYMAFKHLHLAAIALSLLFLILQGSPFNGQ